MPFPFSDIEKAGTTKMHAAANNATKSRICFIF
jgi:hypothetical protein